MTKKIVVLAVAAIMTLGIFGITACEQRGIRVEVISLVTKLNDAKELKFVVEPNIEHSNQIHIAVQKYNNDGQLIYMHNKMVHYETGEVTTDRLYQNGKDFDRLNKTYYDIVLTQNSSLGVIPDIGLLGLESTTFEKKNSNEYLITIYPQNLINGNMFGDMVFEYTIKKESNFISEILFAGKKATISRDIGQQIIIDEFEFTRRAY